MDERLLNINEAADLLHLSLEEVEALVNEGKIPAFHLDGKYLRFRHEDLAAVNASLSNQKKEEKEGVSHYTFRDGLHDFFYFNDFYLLSILLILLILFAILRI